MKQEYYIGLDGHSTTCTFVTLNKNGDMVDRCQVKTTEGNLLGYVKKHKGIINVVFEETNLSKWFYTLFKDKVDNLVACNPVYIGPKPGAKGDFKDALNLAHELHCGHVTAVFHEENEYINLRAITGAYNDLVREITRAKNRYKALFRSEALPTKGKTIYNEPARIKELSIEADQVVAVNLHRQIKHLEGIKSDYLSVFKENTHKYPLLKKLCTIPGFDVVRSHIVLAYVCSPERFKNKHKFWAYSMLVKYTDISDGKIYGKRKIHGRTELKMVFDGAAESIMKGNSSLRKYYDRLRSNSISHKNAKKAVARKIAAICLSILKNDTKFDDKYEEKQRRLNRIKKSQ